MAQPDESGTDRKGAGQYKPAAVVAAAAALLLLAWVLYMVADLNSEVRDLQMELARIQARYESLPVRDFDQQLQRLQRELESDVRARLEALETRTELLRRPEEPQIGGDAPQPDLAALLSGTGTDEELGPYSYEVIQVTQFDVQDGQEVIYTKKSNLAQFFTPERAMRIVATHMFPVWQDYYLLVIFQE